MNFNEAPPPENRRKGYKPDPTGEANARWWDGNEWTEHVSDMEIGQDKPSRKMPRWLVITLCAFGALIVVAAILGEEEEDPTPPKETAAKTAAAPERPPADSQSAKTNDRAEEPVSTVDPAQEMTDALDGVEAPGGDPGVKDVTVIGRNALVELETPSGGFEGPSTDDMNYQVGAVFRRIYKDTDHKGSVTIQFSGGLVNTKTGAESPDSVTGTYVIRADEARQIDWDDEDVVDYIIDWDLYRTFVHPAIKQ